MPTREDSGKIIPPLQKAITSIDPGVPISQAKTFSDVIDSMLVVRRLAVLLTSILSSAALFLSAVGLYGVSGSDPVTLGFATVVLGLTALLACLFPAINAIRINPIKVLRE